jgi:RNA polymerase sigma-70 factor (ECF subfamily)
MRAFLYHALNGLIIDEYRKQKPISLDALTEGGLELEAINSENIFNIIDGKALTLLIKKLPEKYRSVITMRFVEELTLKEISAIAHQSQNTTSAQVHRSLFKLKMLYATTGIRAFT